jgi:hypothetical protein
MMRWLGELLQLELGRAEGEFKNMPWISTPKLRSAHSQYAVYL